MTSNGEITSSYLLNAPMFQIVWQSSDFSDGSAPARTSSVQPQDSPISASQSSITTHTISRLSATSVLPTDSESTIITSPSIGKQRSGLSTGAKIGIGIAGALGAIAVVSFLLLFVKRQRKYRRVRKEVEPQLPTKNLSAELADHVPYVFELPATPRK